MNFKKLAITGASAALLLGSAAGVFAYGGHHNRGGFDLDVDNDAHVTNNVTTQANTGLNSIGSEDGYPSSLGDGYYGHHRGGVSNSDITTGDAWALSSVLNTVNWNDVDLCGCRGGRGGFDLDVDNDAHVTNDVTTQANTGLNYIGGRRVRNSDIDTGNAGAESWVDNVVNTNLLGSN